MFGLNGIRALSTTLTDVRSVSSAQTNTNRNNERLKYVCFKKKKEKKECTFLIFDIQYALKKEEKKVCTFF